MSFKHLSFSSFPLSTYFFLSFICLFLLGAVILIEHVYFFSGDLIIVSFI